MVEGRWSLRSLLGEAHQEEISVRGSESAERDDVKAWRLLVDHRTPRFRHYTLHSER